MRDPDHPPAIEADAQDPARLRLLGQWTLAHANDIGDCLRRASGPVAAVDATAVERLDSAGVLQLQRFARRCGLGIEAFAFRDIHLDLVHAIKDVADDRPKKKREYGVVAALARLGYAISDNWKEILSLVAFLGENLVKLGRMFMQPRRFRLTATVAQMEQVGLDAVPLVAQLSYLVRAVLAFLGAYILSDFGPT